jgi:hypothetical protein
MQINKNMTQICTKDVAHFENKHGNKTNSTNQTKSLDICKRYTGLEITQQIF